MKTLIDNILKSVDENQRFLITSHMDPDGDSLGSQIAIYYYLKQLGKDVTVVNQGDIPDKYSFLDSENIIQFEMEKLPFEPEVVFVMECPSLDRTGYVENLISDNVFKINIDHHTDNVFYGDIDLVDANSCAVAELVYLIFEQAGFNISPKIAEALHKKIDVLYATNEEKRKKSLIKSTKEKAFIDLSHHRKF